ncbi:MAG: ABC transporter permease [Lachnospiraceae bacterium]|nr:ABC transporter permease [Lachnospiraceae bacterium]
MKLNRRYKRNIRNNLPFYASATVLTMLTLLLFYLFYVAGTGINEFGDSFFARNRCEDATFSAYTEIPEEAVAELETKYVLTMEKEHCAAIDEGKYHARVFASNRKVDLYELQEGHDLSSDGEILISAGYAEEHGLGEGDTIVLKGREYTIAGTFLRPDYLYMVENVSDDYKNVSDFFLAYMTAAEFERQFGTGTINYKVIYGEETDEAAFRREVNEKYYMSGYLNADNNKRITFVHEQADMFIMSSWIELVVFPLLTVALVCILLGRRIRSEQKLIGTLSAMGYDRGRLMRHYSLFAVIPGALGGLLTAVLSLLLAEPFGKIGLADYEPMKPDFRLPLWVAVAGIVIPTAIYYISSMLRVRALLQADTVELLAGAVGNDGKSRRILAKRKLLIRRKMAVRQLIGNPGRSIVIFAGIFLGAMLVAFAFSFLDSVDAVGEKAHEEFGSFKYEYILGTLKEGTPEGAEAVLAMQFEDLESRRFTAMGMDKDAELWNLTTTDGKRADIANGFYISTLFEAIFGVHEGDTFTFRSIATLEEHTVTVRGVIKNGYESYLIASREIIAELCGLPENCYNAVLSEQALPDIEAEATEMITDSTYRTQMENMKQSMAGVIDALMVIGVIVCVAALYATINTLISENAYTISMLKVLGMEDGRINSMMISSNHLLLIPGIAAGIAAAYGVMYWYCVEFVEVENIMIPATLKPVSILLTAALTVFAYAISLILVRGRVNRVNMWMR